jgi:hypothetical protein
MRSMARAVPWVFLLAVVLVGTGLPVVHAHDGAATGIYDEACSFERLATAPAGAILVDHPYAGVPLLAPPILPIPEDPDPGTRPTPPSVSRAPPAA